MDYGQGKFILGDWKVDPLHNILIDQTSTSKIEKRLIRVLVVIANNSPEVVTKEHLLEKVWQGKIVSDETISVAISKLRKALGCNAKKPKYIETITGVGFRLLIEPQLLDPIAEQNKKSETPEKEDKKEKSKKQPQPWHKSRLLYAPLFAFFLLVIAYQAVISTSAPQKGDHSKIIENESYAKALFLMQQGIDGLHQAEVLLNRLYQQQPNNPFILNALGKTLYFQYWYVEEEELIAKAKDLFEQAVKIDTELADAYLQLALIHYVQERNFTIAEEYFIQSIAINPEYVTSHIEYSGMLLSQRRFKEAVHHNKIAQSIDPKHYSSASIEWIYNMAEQYQLAEKELAKLFTIDPDSQLYNTSALRLFESQGDEERAFIHYKKSFALAGYSVEELGESERAFKQGGLKQLNYWLANIKKEQGDIGQYTPPVSTARYHIAAGEYDKAITFLELAHAQDDILTLWFNSDPKYKPLRKLPRFLELSKNIGNTIR